MKVALLSFHNAVNYGATLQAYALEKYLLEQGVDCEYIDYRNHYRRTAYSMSYHIWTSLRKKDLKGGLKYLLGYPFMALRRVRFYAFYKKNIKCTKKVYNSVEEVKELNPYYDKFIVGSDQVWNHTNNGEDFAFLLNFVDDDFKKISYSSSFGLSEIPSHLTDLYSKYLLKINKISVREAYGVDLVKKLTGRNAKLVLDPVFLLSKQQWESLSPQKKIKKPYLFFYTNKANQISDFLKQTKYCLNGKTLYKLSRNMSFSDFLDNQIKVKYTMSPNEFIRVIRDAELIISASFHCISLAIILNKPFIAILTGNQGKDERIINILRLLGLENRAFTPNMEDSDVLLPINYETVNTKIQELLFDSTKFLMDSIRI